MIRHHQVTAILAACTVFAATDSTATAQIAQATQDEAAQHESTAVYDTPTGKLIVHSHMPEPEDYGSPLTFSSLDSNGDGHISKTEASAYPPLANDFLHASGDRNRPISKRQYQRWAAAR